MSGEWRRVWLQGSVEPTEVPVLQGWPPEINGGRDWAASDVDVVGVMFGDLEQITDGFAWVLAAAPSFTATVHVTGVYGQLDVEHTITVAEGKIVVGDPVVSQLREETEIEALEREMASWEDSTGAMRWP